MIRSLIINVIYTGVEPPFTTFRDAAFCINTYPLTVIDCARAFAKVILCGHFNINTFSLQQYESLQRLENGDITWIVPGKFIAFSGPVAEKREISPGVFVLSPEGYVPVFRSLGVTCVIRFNKKCYDRNIFVRAGIHHVDLFYEDGGNPTDSILQVIVHVQMYTCTHVYMYICTYPGYMYAHIYAWNSAVLPINHRSSLLIYAFCSRFFEFVKLKQEQSQCTAKRDWEEQGPISWRT